MSYQLLHPAKSAPNLRKLGGLVQLFEGLHGFLTVGTLARGAGLKCGSLKVTVSELTVTQ